MTPLAYLKLGLGAALLVALTIGYFVVKGWHDDSVKLVTVQASLEHALKQGDDIEKRLIYIDGQRASAERFLSAWQQFAPVLAADLKKAMSNANISKNPICQPTDAERRLHNDTLRALLAGPSANSVSVPPASSSVH